MILEPLKIVVKTPICGCKIDKNKNPYTWFIWCDQTNGACLKLTCPKCKSSHIFSGDELRAHIQVSNVPEKQYTTDIKHKNTGNNSCAQTKKESEDNTKCAKTNKPKQTKKKKSLPSYLKVVK